MTTPLEEELIHAGLTPDKLAYFLRAHAREVVIAKYYHVKLREIMWLCDKWGLYHMTGRGKECMKIVDGVAVKECAK